MHVSDVLGHEKRAANGWQVAIISRGYGGRATAHPTLVQPSRHTAWQVGDELIRAFSGSHGQSVDVYLMLGADGRVGVEARRQQREARGRRLGGRADRLPRGALGVLSRGVLGPARRGRSRSRATTLCCTWR